MPALTNKKDYLAFVTHLAHTPESVYHIAALNFPDYDRTLSEIYHCHYRRRPLSLDSNSQAHYCPRERTRLWGQEPGQIEHGNRYIWKSEEKLPLEPVLNYGDLPQRTAYGFNDPAVQLIISPDFAKPVMQALTMLRAVIQRLDQGHSWHPRETLPGGIRS